jgi:hypothetical protein
MKQINPKENPVTTTTRHPFKLGQKVKSNRYGLAKVIAHKLRPNGLWIEISVKLPIERTPFFYTVRPATLTKA